MKRLKFTPSRLRSWSTLRDKIQTVHITGWADTGDKLVSGVPLVQHILDGLETPLPFSEILRGLNGNFAVVVDSPAAIHTGVDAVRSIPLFYRNETDTIVVSDDARSLYGDGRTIDDRSAVEYATAGFVTGPHTLFHEVSGVQAGECVSWHRGGTTPRTVRYYQYACTYDSDLSVELLCEEFDEVLKAVFRRLVDSLDGRQVIVPLSGGLDSRLIATTLKRLGYDNILCLFYGLPGHPESVMSRDVAKTLGYQWLHVPYISRDWREKFDSTEMHEYWSFASNGVSPPHCDDWPALKELRDKRTPEQQLELLDQRLGEGEGATRERQSLKLEIEKRREARDRSSSERVSERKGSTREKGERSKVNSKERRRRDKSRSRGGRQDAS